MVNLTFEALQNKILGLSEEEACKLIQAKTDYKIRITRRDNAYYLATRDYRLDRINLTFDNGKLTTADLG